MSSRDLTGVRFGRLLVLRKSGRVVYPCGSSMYTWDCLCQCGNFVTINTGALTTGNSKSCGCGRTDALSTHRASKTPEFWIWQGMRQRCSNPKTRKFADYGGRGISVCLRWQKFENFLADMGPRPSPNLSVDRVDTNGNYDPSNCVWATRSDQSRNRRPTKSNPSGVVGVCRQGERWRAYIWHDGKRHNIGTFDTISAAASARRERETAINFHSRENANDHSRV